MLNDLGTKKNAKIPTQNSKYKTAPPNLKPQTQKSVAFQ